MSTSKSKKTKKKLLSKSHQEGNPPYKGVTVRDRQYSESYDEYLENILRLSRKNADEWVKNKEISNALKVKAPSVTNMLEKLSKASFIEWIPRKGIKLTELGIARATELISYHTIMELFLHRVLKMNDAQEVDIIACDFEHHFTPRLNQQLKLLLGLEKENNPPLLEQVIKDHFPYKIHTNPVYSEVETYSLIDTLHQKMKTELNLSDDKLEHLDKMISQFKADSHNTNCTSEICPTKKR